VKKSVSYPDVRMIVKRCDSPHHAEHDNYVSPKLQKKFY